MLVRPGGVAAVLLYHFEDGVHAQVAVRIDGSAVLGGIARQVVGVDAAAAVDLGLVHVNLLIVAHLSADDAGAESGTADDAVGRGRIGRREIAVIADVVVKTGATRSAAGNDRCEAGERVRGTRSQGLQEVNSVLAE